MNRAACLPVLLFTSCWCALAASAQTGYPFQDETLHYSVNWPSGLSLGDVSMTAHRSGRGWDFSMSLNAGVPGFQVADRYHSVANSEGCSVEFQRDVGHGSKKSSEKTSFDYHTLTAHRATLTASGGKSDLPISSCARDALALVYYARQELGQGRVPPQQDAFLGAPHSVRLEYMGAQSIQVADRPETADRVVVYVKGPSSDAQFEIFFARDAARTPLSVRVPLSVGTLSMELVR
jgi:hypothetical protein